MFTDSRKKGLAELLSSAKSLGLPEKDLLVCSDYLNYFEYGLCLTHLIESIEENKTTIDRTFYFEIERFATKMKMSACEYFSLKDLIEK